MARHPDTHSHDFEDKFSAVSKKMRSEGLSEVFINTFREQYRQLVNGETGLITESQISGVNNLPDLDCLSNSPDREIGYSKIGEDSLKKLAVIRLNGGLGTGMGLDRAKSLLPVRDGLSFLDIILRQTIKLRDRFGVKLPLILMNSFRTAEDSERVITAYTHFHAGQGSIPSSFLQHKVPKIIAQSHEAAEWPIDPQLAWCPPGHGDIYSAMVDSGILQKLLDAGFEYAFISNSDNLGATVDLNILGYLTDNKLPFLMEVADRTSADRKGGHLARHLSPAEQSVSDDRHKEKEHRLILREVAQCPESDLEAFQNINSYRYFNTNSIWINLLQLNAALVANNYILPLPLIRNLKTIDPTNPSSPQVYQLETAMGAAISCFENSQAIRVPRSRFAPVKKTDDLLVLWSDIFLLDENGELHQNPRRELGTIFVDLDPIFYKTIGDFTLRFAAGSPSLIDCESLIVRGNVYFGRNVVIRGNVRIENLNQEPLRLENKILSQ